MLRYFIAGFGNQKSAGITEIADGLDLVVFGHQRDRFSNQFVRLPDEVVKQIRHVERDALRLAARMLIG